MIEIAFPEDWSERMAFITAVATMFIGLGLMIFPRLAGRLIGLGPIGTTNNGLSEFRGAFGGVWFGLGLACIILAQPFTYFALGLAFLGAVIGRLISMVFDRTFNIHCVIATVFEVLAVYFPLKFALEVFGLI